MTTVPEHPSQLAGFVEQLIDNGYVPVAMKHGTKEPARHGWPKRPPSAHGFTDYLAQEKRAPNIALRLDNLVVLDIDIRGRERASRVECLALHVLGDTPLRRYGDRRKGGALIYRAKGVVSPWSMTSPDAIELKSGSGQTISAFGIHPQRQAYTWFSGSPLDVPLEELPEINEEMAQRFFAVLKIVNGNATLDEVVDVQPALRKTKEAKTGPLTDGRRDALRNFLAREVGRLKRNKKPITFDILNAAAQLWFFGSGEIDLTKPRGSTRKRWTAKDVQNEVRSILRRLDRIGPMQTRRTWTIEAKRELLAQMQGDRRLTETDLRVAAILLDGHRGDNDDTTNRRRKTGGLASDTIATKAKLHPVTVRKSRSKLVELGYFTAKTGGYRRSLTAEGKVRPGKAPVVVPNDALLADVLMPVRPGSPLVAQTFDVRSPDGVVNTNQVTENVDGTGERVAVSTTEYLYEGISPRVSPSSDDVVPKRVDNDLIRDHPDLFYVDLLGDLRQNPDADPAAVGAALRKMCQMHSSMSQTELARRSDLARGSVSNAMRGHDRLSDIALRKILEVLLAA
jgi:hypothetical protein